MALKDPVAVYNALTNVEAQMLCHMLRQSGIEAHVTEDNSLGGLWMGGTIPHIHTPKVWVDRAEAEQAVPILENYDKTRFERDALMAQGTPDKTIVAAVCEECGQTSTFWARVTGTVQNCPHCGKYMDVAPTGDASEWGEADDETPEETDSEELN